VHLAPPRLIVAAQRQEHVRTVAAVGANRRCGSASASAALGGGGGGGGGGGTGRRRVGEARVDLVEDGAAQRPRVWHAEAEEDGLGAVELVRHRQLHPLVARLARHAPR